jgi:hypothetical protein
MLTATNRTSRLPLIEPESASGVSRELLEGIAAHSEAARKLGLNEHDSALARQGTAYSAEQIAEVAGLVGLNVMTGTFNVIAGVGPEMRTEDV